MKKNLIYFALIFSVVFTACKTDKDVENIATMNIENKLTSPETEWTGDKTGTLNNNGEHVNSFTDGVFTFNNFFNPTYSSWSGFAYTNKSDVTTATYTNNSAITGKAQSGKVYLTVNVNAYSPAKLGFVDNKTHTLKGMYITNATYAYLTIKNGNTFSKKFAAGDWFKLNIIALDEAGKDGKTIEYYLADYRDGKTILKNQWEWVDLSSLGKIAGLRFEMSSTDNGEWGMNTPAYFCADDIKAVME